MPSRAKRLLVGLWALAVIPLTFLGYGSDGDAWRVADSVERMWSEGTYIKSRSVGFPLYEVLVMPLQHVGGWYLTNAFSAVFGLILLGAFFHLSDSGRLRQPVLTSATLAFLPIVLKNSSSTMDFIPALSLLAWAYVWILEGRSFVSALCIGFGCGFRPLMGAFALPVAVLWASRSKSWKRGVAYFGTAAIAGTISYSPALLKYGFIANPVGTKIETSAKVLQWGYRSLRVLGAAQVVLVALIVFLSLMHHGTHPNDARPTFGTDLRLFHIANILLWLALFLYLPAEPEYLLPTVPSVLILLDQLPSRRTFLAVASILLSYHFVQLDLLGGTSGRRQIDASLERGFTVADIEQRRYYLWLRRAATEFRPREPTVLMYGVEYIAKANPQWRLYRWDGQIEAYQQVDGHLVVSSPVTSEDVVKELRASGYRIFFYGGPVAGQIDSLCRRFHMDAVVHSLPEFFRESSRAFSTCPGT